MRKKIDYFHININKASIACRKMPGILSKPDCSFLLEQVKNWVKSHLNCDFLLNVHGSKHSVDLDILICVPIGNYPKNVSSFLSSLSIQINKTFKDVLGYKPLNIHIVSVDKHGHVIKSSAGDPRVVNNGLYDTHSLHPQIDSIFVTSRVDINLPTVARKHLWVLFSCLTRENTLRSEIKSMLKHSTTGDMLNSFRGMDLETFSFSYVPNIKDRIKSFVFKLLQLFHFLNGKEVYTKEGFKTLHPITYSVFDRTWDNKTLTSVMRYLNTIKNQVVEKLLVLFDECGYLHLYHVQCRMPEEVIDIALYIKENGIDTYYEYSKNEFKNMVKWFLKQTSSDQKQFLTDHKLLNIYNNGVRKFMYARDCEFNKPFMLWCRGCSVTDEGIIIWDLPKFWNERQLINIFGLTIPFIIDCGFDMNIQEKVDGSYIKIYWNGSKIVVNTLRSFGNHQMQSNISDDTHRDVVMSCLTDEQITFLRNNPNNALIAELIGPLNVIVTTYDLQTSELRFISLIDVNGCDIRKSHPLASECFDFIKDKTIEVKSKQEFDIVMESEISRLKEDVKRPEGFVVYLNGVPLLKVKDEKWSELHKSGVIMNAGSDAHIIKLLGDHYNDKKSNFLTNFTGEDTDSLITDKIVNKVNEFINYLSALCEKMFKLLIDANGLIRKDVNKYRGTSIEWLLTILFKSRESRTRTYYIMTFKMCVMEYLLEVGKKNKKNIELLADKFGKLNFFNLCLIYFNAKVLNVFDLDNTTFTTPEHTDYRKWNPVPFNNTILKIILDCIKNNTPFVILSGRSSDLMDDITKFFKDNGIILDGNIILCRGKKRPDAFKANVIKHIIKCVKGIPVFHYDDDEVALDLCLSKINDDEPVKRKKKNKEKKNNYNPIHVIGGIPIPYIKESKNKESKINDSVGSKSIIVTICGPPGSGKTTMLKLLSKQFNAGYVSMDVVVLNNPDKNPRQCYDNFVNSINEFCENNKRFVLVDWCMSSASCFKSLRKIPNSTLVTYSFMPDLSSSSSLNRYVDELLKRCSKRIESDNADNSTLYLPSNNTPSDIKLMRSVINKKINSCNHQRVNPIREVIQAPPDLKSLKEYTQWMCKHLNSIEESKKEDKKVLLIKVGVTHLGDKKHITLQYCGGRTEPDQELLDLDGKDVNVTISETAEHKYYTKCLIVADMKTPDGKDIVGKNKYPHITLKCNRHPSDKKECKLLYGKDFNRFITNGYVRPVVSNLMLAMDLNDLIITSTPILLKGRVVVVYK